MSDASAVRGRSMPRLPAWGAGGLLRGSRLPYALLVPSIAILVFVEAYPVFAGMRYSLYGGTLLQRGDFVGLANYTAVLRSPEVLHSLGFTAIFAAAAVAGSYLVGLGLALFLDGAIPGRAVFRVALLIPWVIPSIVAVESWRWLIQDQSGLVNQALHLVGLGPVYFLSSSTWAVVAVIAVKVWRTFPFVMVTLLAALQGIDREMYEAGRIDGAGSWNLFRYLTLPQLRTISIVLVILVVVFSVNDFETPWLLTQGGPAQATQNLVVLAYDYTFSRDFVGAGSAISVMTLVVLAVMSVALLRAQREP
jgi:ABC-type sugar transport system permease subunit